ncbi:MAG TPA: extracellular solute-binding protein [Chloroflexota bacterium]|nr:extracellular solute-binding protein [Chloroflexota bacterium]
MKRLAMPLLLVLALLLAACQPGSQPSASKPADAKPADGQPPPTSGQASAAASKPADAKPAEASKPAEPAKPAAQASGPLVFLSSQFKPVEEAEKMRGTILKGAPVPVDFIPEDPGPFNDRISAEQQTQKVTISLIGGLHGDFAPMVEKKQLEDLTPLASKLNDRGFPAPFVELSRFGQQGKTYYVPWMQATYVMAVNKKALQHLPQGADVNALTYKQLAEWGANIQKATNQRKVGFPGGPKGLIHRFFQGYLYPSYTGSSGVVGFKTPEAVTMWQEFKAIWEVSNPQSANYEFMQEPLLGDEVWVAWDHTARLINAVKEKPDDYVLVPAPAGPKGRGFMPVITGLAIPTGAPNRAGAEQTIEYLTQPQQQVATLRELAFFPSTNAQIPADLPPGIRLEADAVQKQATAKDAMPSLLPIGLGAKNGELNKVYLDTFQRIVLKGEQIQPVLDEQAKILQGILDETKAGCWAPDPPSDGPCKVK